MKRETNSVRGWRALWIGIAFEDEYERCATNNSSQRTTKNLYIFFMSIKSINKWEGGEEEGGFCWGNHLPFNCTNYSKRSWLLLLLLLSIFCFHYSIAFNSFKGSIRQHLNLTLTKTKTQFMLILLLIINITSSFQWVCNPIGNLNTYNKKSVIFKNLPTTIKRARFLYEIRDQSTMSRILNTRWLLIEAMYMRQHYSTSAKNNSYVNRYMHWKAEDETND